MIFSMESFGYFCCSFSAPLHHVWIRAGPNPASNAALTVLLYNTSFGRNWLAAATPMGKTQESWCQGHGAWERCGFGRRTIAFLHNCAKYSSCDKTLQYITGYLGQGLHFP